MKNLGLVKVFLKEYGEKVTITFGELMHEDSSTFRVHSSSTNFNKTKYSYKKILN